MYLGKCFVLLAAIYALMYGGVQAAEDYCRILGLKGYTTEKEVTEAYQKKYKEAGAAEKFQEIREAYEFVMSEKACVSHGGYGGGPKNSKKYSYSSNQPQKNDLKTATRILHIIGDIVIPVFRLLYLFGFYLIKGIMAPIFWIVSFFDR